MNLKDFVHSHLKKIDRELAFEEISEPSNWKLCTKKLYNVKLRRADTQRKYNTEENGVVYNFLEDAYEPALEGSYIVEGTKGELWVISEDRLSKYDVSPDDIGYEPIEAMTKPASQKYYCLKIPADTSFSLELNGFSLKGNRENVAHGSGDCLVTGAVLIDGNYLMPDDIEDMWVVNGEVFEDTYEII